MAMKDRRKFDRFAIDTPVRIEVLETERRGEIIDLEADNLSAGGIFFQPSTPLSVGIRVKVSMMLQFDDLQTTEDPEGTLIITVTGHVVRSGEEGTAIGFSDDYNVITSFEVRGKERTEAYDRFERTVMAHPMHV